MGAERLLEAGGGGVQQQAAADEIFERIKALYTPLAAAQP